MKSESMPAGKAVRIAVAGWVIAAGLAAPVRAQDAARPPGVQPQPPVPLPPLPKPQEPDQPKPEEPAPAPGEPAPDKPAEPPPPEAAPEPEPDENPRYPISRFIIEYGREAPHLPSVDELYDIQVDLAKTDAGYTATTGAPPDAKPVRIRLGDVYEAEPASFDARAIGRITAAVVGELQRRGLVGLFVAPHFDDIDEATNADLREDRTAMRLQIWVAVVKEMRTIASGERIPSEHRINNPLHERILRNSIAQPDHLLTREATDDYVFRLNRQPGRRVDVAVSAYGEDPGDVVLDYLVSENRPWSLYAQLSNTGTRSTDEWRERFGFVHNQLTGNDDIFKLDVLTAGFEKTNALVTSYDFPVYSDKLRFKPYGSASEFQASDLGLRDEKFSGRTWVGGGEFALNIAQFGPSFIDVVGGARWEYVTVSDDVLGTEGVTNYFLPYAGARYNRDTDDTSSYAGFTIEGTVSAISNTDPEEVEQLGRRQADLDWVVLKWEIGHQFYLEPLFNKAAWRGETTKGATLAHELAFSARGQWAFFDDRMIPQAEDVAGGFYSVRGYPESIIAGDTVYIASAEYRLHIPRLLGMPATEAERAASRSTLFGEQFRWRPEQPFGRPDWDLIFRTFLDVGRAENSRKIVGEFNDTLVGAGFGLELQLRRNLFIRGDVGWALDGISHPDVVVSEGSSRLHFSATLVY